MNSFLMYKIIITNHLKKQLKRLLKKDHSLKENLRGALLNFNKSTSIPIGSGVYKIRIAREGKGKSGGYRAYLFVLELEGILAPICIYPKNEKEDLTYAELTHHLKKTKENLMNL